MLTCFPSNSFKAPHTCPLHLKLQALSVTSQPSYQNKPNPNLTPISPSPTISHIGCTPFCDPTLPIPSKIKKIQLLLFIKKKTKWSALQLVKVGNTSLVHQTCKIMFFCNPFTRNVHKRRGKCYVTFYMDVVVNIFTLGCC